MTKTRKRNPRQKLLAFDPVEEQNENPATTPLQEVIEEMETYILLFSGSEKRYQEFLKGRKQRKGECNPDYSFLTKRSHFGAWIKALKEYKAELDAAFDLLDEE